MLKILHSQIFIKPILDPKISFDGQTVIVTGSNTGLGRETARILVELKAAKVILAVRTVEKGQQAKDYIDKSTGRKDVTEVWQVDLSNYASVKSFVQKANNLERIDAVIENAGLWPIKHDEAEGHETTITVNVISTYLMALMLLPKMQETASRFSVTPRMTILTSALHNLAKLSARSSPRIFEALKEPVKDFDMRYNDSKLLVIIYGEKLAAALTESDKPSVTLNFVNPGYCVSELIRDRGFSDSIFEKMLARSTEEGAFALVDAVAGGKPERHGKYINDMVIQTPATVKKTKSGQSINTRVWEELNEILDDIEPGVRDFLQ